MLKIISLLSDINIEHLREFYNTQNLILYLYCLQRHQKSIFRFGSNIQTQFFPIMSPKPKPFGKSCLSLL